MRTIVLLVLLLIAVSPAAHSQKRNWYKQSDRGNGRSQGSEPYTLSNRVLIKWVPSAFIRFPESVLRFGAEYCFARYFGVGVEGGKVLSRLRSLPVSSRATGGLDLHIEPRFYYSRSSDLRGFIGVQGFYRTMAYDSGVLTAHNNYGDVTQISQSSAQATIRGIGFVTGFVTYLGSGIQFELGAGIGTKHVHIDRQGVATVTAPQSSHPLFLSERDILDDDDLPYIIFDIKLSGLLGGRN